MLVEVVDGVEGVEVEDEGGLAGELEAGLVGFVLEGDRGFIEGAGF